MEKNRLINVLKFIGSKNEKYSLSDGIWIEKMIRNSENSEELYYLIMNDKDIDYKLNPRTLNTILIDSQRPYETYRKISPKIDFKLSLENVKNLKVGDGIFNLVESDLVNLRYYTLSMIELVSKERRVELFKLIYSKNPKIFSEIDITNYESFFYHLSYDENLTREIYNVLLQDEYFLDVIRRESKILKYFLLMTNDIDLFTKVVGKDVSRSVETLSVAEIIDMINYANDIKGFIEIAYRQIVNKLGDKNSVNPLYTLLTSDKRNVRYFVNNVVLRESNILNNIGYDKLHRIFILSDDMSELVKVLGSRLDVYYKMLAKGELFEDTIPRIMKFSKIQGEFARHILKSKSFMGNATIVNIYNVLGYIEDPDLLNELKVYAERVRPDILKLKNML